MPSRYKPARYKRGGRLLPASERHLVNRFSYGVDRRLARDVRRGDGAVAWFEEQLRPARIPDEAADALAGWWPSLARGPQELWERSASDVEPGWQVMQDYQRWLLLRRLTSQRQLLEVMTEFWEGHLHVAVNGDPCFTWRVDYGRTIRAHALGRFSDLLQATTTHPAMGIFLDNATSTARHPNENLGRELLELHTVGRQHYTEADVRDSARILTGWRVDMWRTWESVYVPEDHWVGEVRVLDFTDRNADADGRAVTRRYLHYLATHPATAQRLCRKLAVKFVRDDPPQSLVDHLAQVYLRTGTDITAVLRALVATDAFRAARDLKVRDPGEDVVATYRVLGVEVRRPTSPDSAANAMLWQCGRLGALPFGWSRPDGPPIDNGSWATVSRMMGSFGVHHQLAGGWWPDEDVHYRSRPAWLPERRLRFDEFVDHLSRVLLHRRSTRRLLKACCKATGASPDEQLSPDHPIVLWRMPVLLSTVLDSPAHMSR